MQGLVKICFPQDVLEEIGIEVVTQHMQNEGASQENIFKMTKIFLSEMIHRVTWMLAEYLDTPARVEASVKAVMAASASLHGGKIGEDVLGKVTASLDKLREQFPHNSTEGLANSTDVDTLAFSTPHRGIVQNESGTSMPLDRQGVKNMANGSEESTEDEIEQLRPSKKTKRKNDNTTKTSGTSQLNKDASVHDTPDGTEEEVSLQYTREGKEGRISTSWRWDVDEGAALGDVADNFKRTSDLFAYHALPIAKRQLGSRAKRKDLRQSMETMLAKMPNEELAKWVESFQKLENGDASMLERISVSAISAGQRLGSATPAPISSRNPSRSAKEKAPFPAKENINGTHALVGTTVKHESNADRNNLERTSQKSYHATDRDIDAPAKEVMINGNMEPYQARVPSRTPVVDLLWNTTDFELEAQESVVQLIMNRLDSRISATVSHQLLLPSDLIDNGSLSQPSTWMVGETRSQKHY